MIFFCVWIMSLYKPLQKKDFKEDGGNQIKLECVLAVSCWAPGPLESGVGVCELQSLFWTAIQSWDHKCLIGKFNTDSACWCCTAHWKDPEDTRQYRSILYL